MAKCTLNGKDVCTISDVLKEIIPLKIAFPALIKVLQVALYYVVTTADEVVQKFAGKDKNRRIRLS